MKQLLLAVLLLLNVYALHAQTKMSCCAPTATEEFAMNASSKTFINSHPDPLPFVFKSEKGHDISYKTSDGATAHAWEVRAENPTDYYLFVIHEWWGLNDYIKQESEKLADDLGINVIALDLYDKQIATNKEDAAKYMQGVKTERAVAIVKGAYSYVGSNAKVFTIGWCFGGGWSLQASLIGGKQAAGCIMYYGMPEKDISRLKTLNCDVIGFFANKDTWITPKVVDEFEEKMKVAGKKLIVYRYDADHTFANPSSPKHDEAASKDCYAKVLAFVKERIK